MADGIVMIPDNDKSRTISAMGEEEFKELYGENENSVIENVLRCVLYLNRNRDNSFYF